MDLHKKYLQIAALDENGKLISEDYNNQFS
jgi:hypothetical protein